MPTVKSPYSAHALPRGGLRRLGAILLAVLMAGLLFGTGARSEAAHGALAVVSSSGEDRTHRASASVEALGENRERWADEASALLRGLAARAAVGSGPQHRANESLTRWQWPLPGPRRIFARFDGPDQPWLSGHRGVDLTGYDGLPVLAVADGVVAYSGTINGVGIVSVQHKDGLRSTYQPIAAVVKGGEPVRAGLRIGYLETTGSHCWPRACLHLGARRGTAYLDPLLLLGAWEVSLLPTE